MIFIVCCCIWVVRWILLLLLASLLIVFACLLLRLLFWSCCVVLCDLFVLVWLGWCSLLVILGFVGGFLKLFVYLEYCWLVLCLLIRFCFVCVVLWFGDLLRFGSLVSLWFDIWVRGVLVIWPWRCFWIIVGWNFFGIWQFLWVSWSRFGFWGLFISVFYFFFCLFSVGFELFGCFQVLNLAVLLIFCFWWVCSVWECIRQNFFGIWGFGGFSWSRVAFEYLLIWVLWFCFCLLVLGLALG